MKHLTDENFDMEIKNSSKPVLVDFYAVWCPPCQILSPILDKIEKEYEERIFFTKVNVDLAPLVSQRFGVSSIPTVVLFKEGQPKSGFLGVRPEEDIKKWLEENLK